MPLINIKICLEHNLNSYKLTDNIQYLCQQEFNKISLYSFLHIILFNQYESQRQRLEGMPITFSLDVNLCKMWQLSTAVNFYCNRKVNWDTKKWKTWNERNEELADDTILLPPLWPFLWTLGVELGSSTMSVCVAHHQKHLTISKERITSPAKNTYILP